MPKDLGDTNGVEKRALVYEGVYEVVCWIPDADWKPGDLARESQFERNCEEMASRGEIRLIGFVRKPGRA